MIPLKTDQIPASCSALFFKTQGFFYNLVLWPLLLTSVSTNVILGEKVSNTKDFLSAQYLYQYSADSTFPHCVSRQYEI